MIEYYGRDGRPISLKEWSRLLGDSEYKRVASTDVGPYWVSTVWLGLDHGFIEGGPPIIFETLVFTVSERDDPMHRGLTDIDGQRYSTEAEALAGHEEIVTLVRATMQETFEEGGTDGQHQGGQGGSDSHPGAEPGDAHR